MFPPGRERALTFAIPGAAGALTVRTPLLLPLAAAGAAVGAAGWHTLSCGELGPGAAPGCALWALAFLYFAGMNACAAVCHCFAPRGSAAAVAAGALDVAFTGECSEARPCV